MSARAAHGNSVDHLPYARLNLSEQTRLRIEHCRLRRGRHAHGWHALPYNWSKVQASVGDVILHILCSDELNANSTASLHCPSSMTSSSLLAIVHSALRMFNASWPCLAVPTPLRTTIFPNEEQGVYSFCSQLSDRHLNYILLLSSSSIEPDIEILLHGKLHQPSN